MLGNKVVVLGGTGFVGRAIVNDLSKQGYEISVCVRRPQRHREFSLFQNTKVVELAEMTDELLNEVLDGSDILVNLIADMTAGSETVAISDLVEVTQKIKQSSDHAGTQRVIHLSQIGANSMQQTSKYLAALGESDAIINNVVAEETIFKAGLLIGERDETTSRFSSQLDRVALLPVYQAETLIQPLWIGDFAKAVVGSIKNSNTFGEKLELVGEERLSLKDLAERVKEVKGKESALVLPMCKLNAKIMSALGGFSPVSSISTEQTLNLSADLISNQDFSTQFGFIPISLEKVLSNTLVEDDIRARYNDMRQGAGRNVEELV